MRVLSIVGNRPQFIKSGPLSVALRKAGIDEVLLHTGQHWDDELSQVFFDELGLPEPRYRLDLHTADPAAMEPGIRDAVDRERPDWTLVYGDTNSTLAGAHAHSRAAVRPRTARPGARAAQLRRHARPRLAGAGDRHRLRRPAKGGLLVRRPVRDRAALDGMDRYRRGRRKRARGRRSRAA